MNQQELYYTRSQSSYMYVVVIYGLTYLMKLMRITYTENKQQFLSIKLMNPFHCQYVPIFKTEFN